MTEDQRPYYEAFYGAELPQRLIEASKEVFPPMVRDMTNDIKELYPDIDKDWLPDLVKAGLKGLAAQDVNHPNSYSKNPKFASAALAAIKAKYRQLKEIQQTREDAENYRLMSEEEWVKANEMSEIKGQAILFIESRIKHHLSEGEDKDTAKVLGFIDYLDENQHPQGYEYYLAGRLIPKDLQILDRDEVVEAMNRHPALRTMKRKLLKDRGKKLPPWMED